MANKLIESNPKSQQQAIIEALAEIVDQPVSWSGEKTRRETAFQALLDAGAVPQLIAITQDNVKPLDLRQRALNRLTELVTGGGTEVTLSETDIQGILKVHTQTKQLKVK